MFPIETKRAFDITMSLNSLVLMLLNEIELKMAELEEECDSKEVKSETEK